MAASRQTAKALSATELYADSLVWDNHGCLLFDEESMRRIHRYRTAGVNVAVLNIADADVPLETLVVSAARIRDFIRRHPEDFLMVERFGDIHRARQSGRVALCLNVEGAFSLGTEPALLSLFYQIGVRWMLMVYNKRNLAGSGCQDDEDQGLTDYGREIVREMDRVGIIKCCSHTGYKTAMDVLTSTTKPTIFSHSNPRALRDHPRNIPDELMTACAATGGVVCINGVSTFLKDGQADPAIFAQTIDYVAQRIGTAHVGIGLDYCFNQDALTALIAANPDMWPASLGYGPSMKFLEPEQLPDVTEHLLRAGYGETDVRAILGENLLRLANTVWPS